MAAAAAVGMGVVGAVGALQQGQSAKTIADMNAVQASTSFASDKEPCRNLIAALPFAAACA